MRRSGLLPILACFLVVGGVRGEQVTSSPDKRYAAEISKDVDGMVQLKIKKEARLLLETSSGNGGFQGVFWSPDSTYLAVVEHGTKTSMTLQVFSVVGDKVTAIDLPDFRLNILGRFNRIKGGRYRFDHSLGWKDGNELVFKTSGSLRKGVSNPSDESDNWYHYDVVIKLTGHSGNLVSVQPSTEVNKRPWK